MKLEDLRQQVRAELAAVDPDGTADPAEIDRLVREVIVFLSTSAEDQVNAAARIAEASPSPRDRELWLRRAERLRQGVVALQVALNELGPAPGLMPIHNYIPDADIPLSRITRSRPG
jgi:hypothetical protein